tara:strand:+ start:1112 stop:1318 length:207 start_codon:yes stop_codon:yes gene_type:complete
MTTPYSFGPKPGTEFRSISYTSAELKKLIATGELNSDDQKYAEDRIKEIKGFKSGGMIEKAMGPGGKK